MKRFGKCVLDPAHVMAVVPAPSAGIVGRAGTSHYHVVFFNGTLVSIDAASAEPLINALTPNDPPTEGARP